MRGCLCVWVERGSAHKQGGRDHNSKCERGSVSSPTDGLTCYKSHQRQRWTDLPALLRKKTHTHAHGDRQGGCVRVDLLPVFHQFHHVLLAKCKFWSFSVHCDSCGICVCLWAFHFLFALMCVCLCVGMFLYLLSSVYKGVCAHPVSSPSCLSLCVCVPVQSCPVD